MALWAGRFSKEIDAGVNAFNSSISFDARMYRQDIGRVCLSVSARNSDYCAGRADNWTICKKCEKIHGTGAGSTGTQ